MKASNYGADYVYACLQKCVGDAIVAAGMEKDILISLEDAKAASNDTQWWMTINGLGGRVGIVDANGQFESRDLQMILNKTEQGVQINFDLVFSLRLTLENGEDRKNQHAFRIVPDCSRGAIKALRQDIEPPSIDSQIPQQKAVKGDVASQELIDAIDALII